MSKTNKKRKSRSKNENENENENETEFYKVNSLNDFIVQDDEEDDSFCSTKFEVDIETIRKELALSLSEKLNIDENKILPIISKVFLNNKDKSLNWKYDVNEKIEPELLSIREEMDNEIPTISKIITSNITKNDKKQCLRIFEQMNTVEYCSEDYFRFIDEINLILNKGKIYSKSEINFLESEEEKLKKIYLSSDSLKTKILKLEADLDIKAKLLAQYEQMLSYPTDSTTHTSLKEEIEWSIKLPYQKREIDPYVYMNNSQLNKFYCEIQKKLDKELFGMEKVKNRILHILNDRKSSGDECGRNIALVGNPGVGKTEIGKVLGKILNKKFAKISAATLDKASIKGANKVYVGAEPSMILQILAESKTNNIIIMIDEVDKVDIKCQEALLHVSDTSDNKEFQDNYLKNFTHDLSKVMFIFNLNSIEGLHPALLDRFDIIHVDDYTDEEKFQIFKNYMLPKALEKIGMKRNDVIVLNSAIKKLFEERKNLSLRSIEKLIKDIVGKINMYRNVILSDGSLGDFHLPYIIPNFKLPLKIEYNLLINLIS